MAQGENGDTGTVVLSWLTGATTLVAVILFGLGQALRLPAHFGVEDWLGWTGIEALNAAKLAWQPAHGVETNAAAVAYLLIDTAVFMPLYGLTLWWATKQVWCTLRPPRGWWLRLLHKFSYPALLALWICDGTENLSGLARLGISVWLGTGAVGLAGVGLWLICRWIRSTHGVHGAVAMAWGAAAVAGIGWLAYRLQLGEPNWDWIFAWPHANKKWFELAAIGPLAILWLAWWFGLDVDPSQEDVLKKQDGISPGEVRAAYRQVAMGVIGRSGYVLAMLVVFGVFTLGLDQCRDVLLALASTRAAGGWWWGIMLTSALALGMLSHACWQWTRIVGRVKRRGYELPGQQGIPDWAGQWARTWARLLMLAPLVMMSILIANVAGDAAIAARYSKDTSQLLVTQWQLFLFAASLVLLAYMLMAAKRKHPLPRPRAYYNDEPSVRELLKDPDVYNGRLAPNAKRPLQTESAPRLVQALRPLRMKLGLMVRPVARPIARGPYLLWRPINRCISKVSQPIAQPLLALTLLLAVRAVMAYFPETTGGAPPTLAVVALSMVWWLGPLGLIGTHEHRAVFPWGLLLLVAAGWMGTVSDNHVLPALVIDEPDAVDGVLRAIGHVAFGGVAVLTVCSALLWLVLALPTPGRFAKDTREFKANVLRTGLVVTLVAAMCGGLLWVEHRAVRAKSQAIEQALQAAAQAAQASVPPALAASAACAPAVAAAASAADGMPLLIASEGGGVRAAYWTARVLTEVAIANPGWRERIHTMSGVSGGAMGIGVWRACLRQTEGKAERKDTDSAMLDCISKGFDNLDSLSPLLAGLLFEDVWMRLLPTDKLCSREHGCAMRSRAMAFEREWMRGFHHLAQPLGRARPGEPELLMNSTVVESGNRGVMATCQFADGQLPGAEDLLASGRVATAPSLVTAAHTSARFPGTNPLASLPHHDDKPGKKLAAAHLVDGGYHDVSGAGSLADVLALLRANAPDQPAQVVLIRNGQIPASCSPQALKEGDKEPPKECLNPTPDGRELLPPRDAQRLGLFADLLGPVVTVLNNTGSNPREFVARLASRAAGAPDKVQAGMGCQKDGPLCLLDQMEDSSLVPLGWSLSRAARDAMDVRAGCVAYQVARQREANAEALKKLKERLSGQCE